MRSYWPLCSCWRCLRRRCTAAPPCRWSCWSSGSSCSGSCWSWSSRSCPGASPGCWTPGWRRGPAAARTRVNVITSQQHQDSIFITQNQSCPFIWKQLHARLLIETTQTIALFWLFTACISAQTSYRHMYKIELQKRLAKISQSWRRPLLRPMIFAAASQFHVYLPCLGACLA